MKIFKRTSLTKSGNKYPNVLSFYFVVFIKVSGPFDETSCVFQCIKNIINAEMWA